MHITASIVSHGHGACVLSLIRQLAALNEPLLGRVILTFNRPEPGLRQQLQNLSTPFELRFLENPRPLGFGANHNRAFACDAEQGGGNALFAVLNPDVCLKSNPFPPLVAALRAAPTAALTYPVQLDSQGALQDHERLVPTPARLLRRYALGQRHELQAGQSAEWVNAAFLLLRRQAWVSVSGFDEGYRMYCEDVDLCLRLQLAGWRLQAAPDAVVEHAGQRDSRRLGAHMVWHLRSLWRLWRSPVWKSYARNQALKS